jgi:ABC-type glutathione transport system ATPase component
MPKVLDFQQVSVTYPNGKRALDEVSFSITAGECFALVGESGCGKSTLAHAALGVLPPKTKIDGAIFADGKEIVNSSAKILRKLRGLVVGFVAQDPFSACNPLATVQDFVGEAWRVHSIVPPKNAVENSLENLGIEDAKSKIKQFPNAWSGGMLQRAGIAAAAAHSPKLIIADEPTSALDAELNKSVLESLRKLKTAVLLISHDLKLVEKYADRIAVMFDGKIVESGAAQDVFQNPQHEYTKKLLSVSRPKMRETAQISEIAKTVLEARNLGHFYEQNELIEDLNMEIKEGEIIGICGASGCGKSTLLRLISTIESQKRGEIYLGGELASNGETRKLLSRNTRNGFVIPVFQDSLASLDRRWAIWRIITEPLTAKHRKKKFSKRERREIAKEKLGEVGLENVNSDARPTELSIGQCQRIAIARALTAEAKIITADEPTSSLDVLSGERIMKLFTETARKGTAIIIVSHDKELLNRWCHRVFSMQNGGLETL